VGANKQVGRGSKGKGLLGHVVGKVNWVLWIQLELKQLPWEAYE